MEIRIAKIFKKTQNESTKVDFFDTLDIEKFKKFEKSIATIEEFHSIQRLLDFVILNDKDVTDYFSESLNILVKKAKVWDEVSRKDGEIIFLNMNRLFLNYLSSIRTFLDHSETYLKRKYGDNSNEIKKHKEIISCFFDKSFAYRFFYKLRNYSQHIDLPINSTSFNARYDREKNSITGKLTVGFNVIKLLNSYNSWGIVKKDLEKKDELELIPLLFEMTHNVSEIKRNLGLIIKKDLLAAAKYINDLTQHLQNDNGEIFIAHNFQTNENNEFLGYESINIPFDTINFINQNYN